MARPVGGALVAVAVVVTALNLRPAVVTVSPVLVRIREQLDLSPAVAGLLTTTPLVCFGLLAPAAPRLARRFGLEPTVMLSLLLLAAGITLRLAPPVELLFLGSFLAGIAIAIANVLMPAVVKRDFPHRAGLMTGLYSGALNIGAGLAAGTAVPLTVALGGSWRSALAVWALPALLAVGIWLPSRREWAPPPRLVTTGLGHLWRNRLAWVVSLYLACQSFEFYATAAWVPTLFVDNGVSASTAGWLLAWSSGTGFAGAVIFPTIAGRFRQQSGAISVVMALYGLGLGGLLVAPAAAPWVWMTLFGVAQGAGFALALLLISLRSPDARVAAQLSGMAQCIAYLVAALGPVVLGALHGFTGNWHAPVGVLLGMLVPMSVLGWVGGRDRQVRPDRPATVRPPVNVG